MATSVTILAPQMDASDELHFDTAPYDRFTLMAVGLRPGETVRAWMPTPDGVDSAVVFTLTDSTPVWDGVGCAPLVLIKSLTTADVGVFAYVR